MATEVAHRDAEGYRDSSERRYGRIEAMLASEQCVMLDGGIGTELIDAAAAPPERNEDYWGVGAIVSVPEQVQRVHGRYAAAGCDVISTSTWGLPSALRNGGVGLRDSSRPVHWMDLARRGVGLARAAATEAGREELAVAFSLNGEIDSPDGTETVRLLGRAFEREPPDLILLETLTVVRDSTYETVQRLLALGLPVWLSFRRCRHGLCGVYGEHWGGPEGDAFGRAAHRFEQLGVSALLINCVPPDHVPGMISWLRDFTELSLGVYPNLGYLSADGWRHEHGVDGPEYAELALAWREEGAQIVGGCCGVGPEQIAAAAAALEDTKPGRGRCDESAHDEIAPAFPVVVPRRWTDHRDRTLFPLDFPDIIVDEGVFPPTQGSFLVWKHLFRERVGEGRRCLDIGCGSGLLTVQLALNGAAHVHAIDIDQVAVSNTLTSAFRNGVADVVSAARADLYPWVPEERYDVIVASLYQMPVDPLEGVASHRPLDFWGRNMIDHLIGLLPSALAEDGVAYVMQLSIVGQRRTAELLERAGLRSRVADYGFFEFTRPFDERAEQIARVEEHSDAYHLRPGGNVMIAYLLEITHGEVRS